MARKHRSPVKLHPAVYDAWLKEEPKRIDGGPIVLKTPSNPVDAEEVYFGSRVVRTNKLPPQYAENLMIYSEYDEFSGSKFHVGPKRPADYLLAAHQLHCGSFNDYLGQEFVNGEAHYHEWDYYSTKGDGSPSKRTKVPPSLSPGMAAHELLEAFLNDYHFDDGRDGPVTPAMKPKLIQERL